MEPIAVSFTDSGAPKTGLSPTIKIIGRNGTVFVENGGCQEIGSGRYVYNFDNYSPEMTYLYVFDGGSSLSDYDRYKFGGNDFDAYANKYSWGRTAAPYMVNYTPQIDSVKKLINDIEKKRKQYDDSDVKKSLKKIETAIKGKGGYDVYKKLDELSGILSDVKDSMLNNSTSAEGRRSEISAGINEKLDLMAQYVVKIKGDIDSELSTLDENVAQRIQESNNNINEGMSSRVTIDQLLQQIARLEDRLNEVVDSVVSSRLPQELTDKYNVNVSRKPRMTDEEFLSMLGQGQDMGAGMGTGDMGSMEGLPQMPENPELDSLPEVEGGVSSPEAMATRRGPKTDNVMPLSM